MALTQKLSNIAANAQADAVARLLDNGYLRIYDSTGGTGQPATADTAIGSQVLLAELRFSATSAPAAVAGVLTFNAITPDSSADATGTATWFRTFKSDGTTAVLDGSIGTSVSNIVMATVAIQVLAVVSVSALTLTDSKL